MATSSINPETFSGVLTAIEEFTEKDPAPLKTNQILDKFIWKKYTTDEEIGTTVVGSQRAAFGQLDSQSIECLVHTQLIDPEYSYMLKQTSIGKLVATMNIRLYTKGNVRFTDGAFIAPVVDIFYGIGDEQGAYGDVDENAFPGNIQTNADKEFAYTMTRLLGEKFRKLNNGQFPPNNEMIAYASGVVVQSTDFERRVRPTWGDDNVGVYESYGYDGERTAIAVEDTL